MKTIALLIFFALATGCVFGRETKAHYPVRILATKMDIFYFKVDHEFLGAELEVYSATGELMLSQKITQRKVLIDFYNGEKGNYTIKIKKGDREETFQYVKSNPSPVVTSPEIISVAQGI